MKNNDKFNINSFNSPEVSYAPVYVWVWNDVCTRELIDAQILEMQNLGIKAFYILPEPKHFRPDSMPTNLEPEYLSKEYFELCAYATGQAQELGMSCWIYDEGGWPSGSACGRVMKEHPEYGRETLEFCERSFSKGEVYKKTSPDILAAFLNDTEIIEEGYVFSIDSVVTEFYIDKDTNSSYPDLLNRDVTEHFIDLTHKKYVLGDNITALFTDEPKAPACAFNKALAEKYEATYGESILPHLPLLAERVGVTEDNAHILHRWYDLCSRMLCEKFLLPCKAWANSNGMAFTGHMDKDHSPDGCMDGGGNFNLMRALRCFDIPGIDVIWRQLYPEKQVANKDDMNGYNGFYPRYASSAAAQNGTRLAMSESFGVAGPGLTYDIMRFTVGYQAVRGINIFNLFNFPLGRNGHLLAQELPVFTENQFYYNQLPQINRYMERLSYIATLGERVCETGLYYPVCNFQSGLNSGAVSKEFDTLGRELEDMLIDFDIVDDDVIWSADGLNEGVLRMGNAEYKNIVVPENAYIPPETQDTLKRFVEHGGMVLNSPESLKPVLRVEGEGLRVMHRKADAENLYLFFRETGKAGEYTIHLPSSKGYILSLENGCLQRLEAENGVLKLSLAVGQSVAVLLTDEDIESEEKFEFNNKIIITNELLFRKELELTCDEKGFKNIKHSEKLTPIQLGNWSKLVGSGFSGSCVYETEFKLASEIVGKQGEIDLGDVQFTAAVILNNQSLGTAIMPPYTLKIPEGLLSESNILKIIVTNTPANWYTHTDYFDKWKTEEMSPYFEVEKEYAKDSNSGGLYGPVAIYTR